MSASPEPEKRGRGQELTERELIALLFTGFLLSALTTYLLLLYLF
jgi:hypothetical protein